MRLGVQHGVPSTVNSLAYWRFNGHNSNRFLVAFDCNPERFWPMICNNLVHFTVTTQFHAKCTFDNNRWENSGAAATKRSALEYNACRTRFTFALRLFAPRSLAGEARA